MAAIVGISEHQTAVRVAYAGRDLGPFLGEDEARVVAHWLRSASDHLIRGLESAARCGRGPNELRVDVTPAPWKMAHVSVDLWPIGVTLTEEEASTVRRWLRSGGLDDLYRIAMRNLAEPEPSEAWAFRGIPRHAIDRQALRWEDETRRLTEG